MICVAVATLVSLVAMLIHFTRKIRASADRADAARASSAKLSQIVAESGAVPHAPAHLSHDFLA